MTKEFCKIMLLAGTILCAGISAANAQTCSTPPSCAALGYTKAKDDCKGIQSLQCPFDTSKYYCFSVAELPPEYNAQGEIAVGAILYSDGTIYKSLKPGKEPIAIVFDVENRLAVALLDQLVTRQLVNISSIAIPGLKNEGVDSITCRIKCPSDKIQTNPMGKYCSASIHVPMFSSAAIVNVPWSSNGRDNTKIISDYCKAKAITCPGIDFINNYKTAGTSAGQWFIPSMKEAMIISANAKQISDIAYSLGKQKLPTSSITAITSSSDGNGQYLSLSISSALNSYCYNASGAYVGADGYMGASKVMLFGGSSSGGAIIPVIKF